MDTVYQAVNGAEDVFDALVEYAGENTYVSAVTGSASNAVSQISDLATSLGVNGVENVAEMYRASEFEYELGVAAYKWFSRKAGSITPLTRADIVGVFRALPASSRAVWGAPADDDFVIAPGLWHEGIAQIINLNRLNRDARIARGNGDPDICKEAAAAIGEPYIDRNGVNQSAPTVIDDGTVTIGVYEFTKVHAGGVISPAFETVMLLPAIDATVDCYIFEVELYESLCGSNPHGCGWSGVSTNYAGLSMLLTGPAAEMDWHGSLAASFNADGLAALTLWRSERYTPEMNQQWAQGAWQAGQTSISFGSGANSTYAVFRSVSLWAGKRVS
jgi:hypothetical protein